MLRAVSPKADAHADEVDLLVEAGDLETLDEALAATAREIATLLIRLDEARRRREELVGGAKELRRRRARNVLDAYIAPVSFFSIEEAD